jgi:hypothetical protein
LTLGDHSLERVSGYFGCPSEHLLSGQINFSELAIRFEPQNVTLPAEYLHAAHGRRRATISAIDFLERWAGWRLKLATVRKFNLPEAELRNPFAPVSVQLLTDICVFLRERGFIDFDYHRMGEFTFEANRGSMVARLLAECMSVAQLYDFYFNQVMPLLEANCHYDLVTLSSTHGVVEVRTISDVGAELGVRHIGSRELCAFKRGIIAVMPRYLGDLPARVCETSCVHRGDSICRFEFDFTPLA